MVCSHVFTQFPPWGFALFPPENFGQPYYTGNDRFSGNDRYSGLQEPDRFFRYIRRLLYLATVKGQMMDFNGLQRYQNILASLVILG